MGLSPRDPPPSRQAIFCRDCHIQEWCHHHRVSPLWSDTHRDSNSLKYRLWSAIYRSFYLFVPKDVHGHKLHQGNERSCFQLSIGWSPLRSRDWTLQPHNLSGYTIRRAPLEIFSHLFRDRQQDNTLPTDPYMCGVSIGHIPLVASWIQELLLAWADWTHPSNFHPISHSAYVLG